jgi:hypothetical protein
VRYPLDQVGVPYAEHGTRRSLPVRTLNWGLVN